MGNASLTILFPVPDGLEKAVAWVSYTAGNLSVCQYNNIVNTGNCLQFRYKSQFYMQVIWLSRKQLEIRSLTTVFRLIWMWMETRTSVLIRLQIRMERELGGMWIWKTTMSSIKLNCIILPFRMMVRYFTQSNIIV